MQNKDSPKVETVSFRITSEVRKLLEKEAAAREWSLSHLIRRILEKEAAKWQEEKS